MTPSFSPHLVNDPFGDPGLYVEIRRAVKPNPFATAKGYPEQTIEADKMIHVGMGEKYILGTKKRSWA